MRGFTSTNKVTHSSALALILLTLALLALALGLQPSAGQPGLAPASSTDNAAANTDQIDQVLESAGVTRSTYGFTSSVFAAKGAAGPGVTVKEVAGTKVSETGPTSDTYTIKLNSQPSASVTVTLGHSGGQVTYSPSSVTFTTSNYGTARTITVTAVNDQVDEAATHTGTITHTVTSTDANYNGRAASSVVADITDNDTAGTTVTVSGGSTAITEGGATDTYTVKLNTKPTANVVVTPAPSGGQATTSPSTLTFTAANWSTAQTVTVTAVDDGYDEASPHSSTISHSATSSDTNYNAIAMSSVNASITDNDAAGVPITQSSGSTSVTEGGATDTYTVRLSTVPAGDVTITPAHAGGQVTVSPSSLTFNSSNWSTPQTVTVTAVNDSRDESSPASASITHTATSGDPAYSGFPVGSVTASVTDNDVSGAVLTHTGGTTTVTEGGGTDTYTVRLSSEPGFNVTVTPANAAGQVTVSPPTLTFTNGDWNTPQTVTVTSVNDQIDEVSPGSTSITHTAASTDPYYAGLSMGSLTTSVVDNDTAGVTVTQSGGSTSVTEGGATDSYTLVLTSQPTANVTLGTTAADGQTSAAPTTVTFTAANWSTPQTVTVTAVNDLIDEVSPGTGTLTHAASSTDPFYNGVSVGSVVAAVHDNDVAGVTVTESAGSTAVTEGGATDSYTLVLDTQPTANVTITPAVGGGQSTVSPSSLTFTAANWNTPRTVTVTAVNDDIDEDPPQNSALTHSAASSDPFYSGIAIDGITASVTDNDVAGVTVTESGGSTAPAEGGANDTYAIQLNSEPTGDVTIAAADLSGEVTVSPVSLTFTAGNWDTPRTVTVAAIDDDIDEDSPHPATVTHDASSADPKYSGISVADVNAAITDNDTAGVTLTLTGPNTMVNEFGATDSFSVRLDSEPLSNVTISSVDPGGQVSLSPSSLTFTPANWDTPQTITITATDDAVDERPPGSPSGPHETTLGNSSSSTDPRYSGIGVADVDIEIRDNDYYGITITETGSYTEVSESATQDSYTVRLNSQPSGGSSVTITLSPPSSEITVSPSVITIAAADWETPVTIDVTAVDNDIEQISPRSTSIPGTTTSNDPNYADLTLETLALEVIDDDEAGVNIVQSGGTTVTEGGAGDSYTLRLNSEPTGDVTVQLTTDGQVTVSPTSVTFTAGNWSTPRSVSVSSVNDLVDEVSPKNSVISAAVSSADPFYSGLAMDSVTVAVTDNDTASTTVALTSGSTQVTEDGSTDSYTVKLGTKPTADVVVTPTVAGGEATVSPATRTFTPANWNTPQSFTVTAVNDTDDEAATHTDVIHHAATSTDGFYQGVAVANVNLQINDNDDYTAPVLAKMSAPLFASVTSKVQRFKVRWGATDTESGVASYDIRYRKARYDKLLAAYTTWKTATTAKSAKLKGKQGYVYCFSQRARDTAGNASAWGAERCTAVPADNGVFKHTGAWVQGKAKGHYLTTYSSTTEKNATLTKTVRAKRITLIATKCPKCGKVKVYLGKTLLKTVNLKSSKRKTNQTIKVKTLSEVKRATLKIKVVTSGKEVTIEAVGLNRG